MSPDATELLENAMQLSDRERADLAASLIESLDPSIDDDWQNAWDAEISRRVSELEDGTAKPIPWSEVRAKLQGKLNELSKR